jgi:uncharacterized membrane protein YvlD (DUF360 family)
VALRPTADALVVTAIAAALVVEGLGFALVVAIGLGVVLAIGYPLLVILAEERQLPMMRRRQ